MPRRKRGALDQVKPAPSEVGQAIAKRLDSLPPTVYGMIAQTADQVAMWRQSREFFSQVGQIIDAHSTGCALPAFKGLSKAERESIESHAWMFTSFYNMAFYNWRAIEPCLQGLGPVNIPPAVSCVDIEGEPHVLEAKLHATALDDLKTPLDLLIEVMRLRAFAMMHNAFSESPREGIPYRARKRLDDVRKARREGASKALVSQAEESIRENLASEPWAMLEHHVVAAVVATVPKRNTAQRQTLDAYLSAIQAEEALWRARFHKRKKPERIVWKNGYQIN